MLSSRPRSRSSRWAPTTTTDTRRRRPSSRSRLPGPGSCAPTRTGGRGRRGPGRAVGGHPLDWAHHGRPHPPPRCRRPRSGHTLVTGAGVPQRAHGHRRPQPPSGTTTTRPSSPRPWRRTRPPATLERSAPSLFSSIRCVVVRGLENLPEESVAGLVDYAAALAEGRRTLVLVHGGGPGSGTLTRLRKLSTVTESKSGELRASEYPGFVAAEMRSHGARIDQDAADALVQAVGQDLRSLAAAADQLANDFPGSRSPPSGSASTSAAGPRPSRSRPTRPSGAGARWRSRSCAGRWTAGPRRCW